MEAYAFRCEWQAFATWADGGVEAAEARTIQPEIKVKPAACTEQVLPGVAKGRRVIKTLS